MATHIKATLIFNAGREVSVADMDTLVDEIVDFLERKFPDYSGSYIVVSSVNENGDPVKN
jgi:hypothetical protein